jgi:hypothetical protein
MSNPNQPRPQWPPLEDEQGRDEMKDSLMERAQEIEHVQARFSNLGAPGQAAEPPDARSSIPVGGPGTVSVHQGPREKIGTFLPTTDGGAWRVAAALRLGAAGFGLMAAALFVLPELSGALQSPTAGVVVAPTFKTIAPALETPPPPADPEKVITEQTTSFDGAAVLVVETEPGNVSVRVDGNDQGNTPVSLTLDCLPGKPIKVELARKGYERAQHLTFCRSNTMIKLYGRLKKAEKSPGGKK